MNQITSRIKFSLGVLTATLVLTSQLPKADAGLTPKVIKDKLGELEVSWSWNPEESGSGNPLLRNWLVTLETKNSSNNWEVKLGVRHIETPHTKLDEREGDFVATDYTFRKNEFGRVISDSFPTSHRPVHRDFYTFSFYRSMAPQNTVIRLTGVHVHVPEPTSTLSLLALGTLGAASTLKRKLKPSQSIKKETTKVG